MLGGAIRAFATAIYNLAAAIVTGLGGDAFTARGWTWTVRDQLSNASEISDRFQTYMQSQGIKAGQFALRKGGTLIMSTAYTWAESGYRITETNFVMRLASCSKIFTTAAILDLIQTQHLLTGDEKVFEYLGITQNAHRVSRDPEPRDPKVRDITVRQLIMHTGGWDYRDRHPTKDPIFHLRDAGRKMNLHRPPTKQEFAEFLFNLKLDFAPGTESHYSNVGYFLLGMVVEKASTRLADRRDNEVRYEDPFFGPDATTNPFDFHTARLPYGGFGAMTELMDSGGGLATSANSLSEVISFYNVNVSDITDAPGRNENSRDGNMAGTSSFACSFSSKGESFDYAVIFNQFEKDHKEPAFPADAFSMFTDSITELIKQHY